MYTGSRVVSGVRFQLSRSLVSTRAGNSVLRRRRLPRVPTTKEGYGGGSRNSPPGRSPYLGRSRGTSRHREEGGLPFPKGSRPGQGPRKRTITWRTVLELSCTSKGSDGVGVEDGQERRFSSTHERWWVVFLSWVPGTPVWDDFGWSGLPSSVFSKWYTLTILLSFLTPSLSLCLCVLVCTYVTSVGPTFPLALSGVVGVLSVGRSSPVEKPLFDLVAGDSPPCRSHVTS